MLMLLEALVIDVGHATGWRIWAWAKLVKVWASLRWSDLQASIPVELSLVEGRLTTVLRRTKTSGPSRRVKELPVAISEHAYFLRSTWLRVGFDLLRTHANYKRLNQDGLLEKKPASYADAMVATAGLLGSLGLPLEVQGYWTEHSEANGGAAPGQGPARPEGSDTYARTFAGRVARLQALFAKVARGADRYDRLDEREIAADLVPWLMERAKLSTEHRANG